MSAPETDRPYYLCWASLEPHPWFPLVATLEAEGWSLVGGDGRYRVAIMRKECEE